MSSRHPHADKIALGTVQWGQPYGVSNRSGQTTPDEVRQILVHAHSQGVSLLDTAADYGEAEQVLGTLPESAGFSITTKTTRARTRHFTVAHRRQVELAFRQSLARLKRQSVHGVFVHHPDDLLGNGGDRLWDTMLSWKADGKVQRVGASVNGPSQVERLLERFPLEIVQLPYSIYDQRFAHLGLLRALKAAGVEIHARSAFLQGALLLEPASLPPHLSALRPTQSRMLARAREHGHSLLSQALAFCLEHPDIDRVVVGCERLSQVQEVLAVPDLDSLTERFAEFAIEDTRIVDPSKWPQ